MGKRIESWTDVELTASDREKYPEFENKRMVVSDEGGSFEIDLNNDIKSDITTLVKRVFQEHRLVLDESITDITVRFEAGYDPYLLMVIINYKKRYTDDVIKKMKFQDIVDRREARERNKKNREKKAEEVRKYIEQYGLPPGLEGKVQ